MINTFIFYDSLQVTIKMEQEEPIHRGVLLLPPVGKLLKKSWQQRFCLLFKASKFGRERLEVYESPDSKDSKIITLEDCIKINSKSPTTFGVTTRTAAHEFGTLNENSTKEWLSAIRSVAFPDEVSKLNSIEEDNDLYCSSGQGVFNVKLHPSPVSQRCGLESKNYTLVLTSTAIQLMNISDNKLLYTWPYCYIRRYGYKSDKFTFEAGRKCESGEGTFFLENPNQQEIFRCLATKMKSMKKLLVGESSPVLDCGDALHAALTMEARSRTPLPPSPTVPTLQDCTLSSKSQFSSSDLDLSKPKPFMKSNMNMLPAVKAKPTKPPRKFAPKRVPVGDQIYEPIDQGYDEVELKNNAWQTLGIDSPNHTEKINEDLSEEDYMSWGEVKQQIETLKQPLAPAIISNNTPIAIRDTYDKLNFFGSTSKLNANSPYKQVFPIPINSSFERPSFNDYDEVQCVDTVVRSVDAELSRDTKEKRDAKVNHQFHNEEAYAIITKPKRV